MSAEKLVDGKPEWSVHPHSCYGVLTRTSLAIIGSIVPIGCAALSSGVARQFDGGLHTVGWVFVVVCAVLAAAWIAGIIKAARAELKDLSDYVMLGSVYPANTFLIYFLAQGVK
jgi:hypothetical protein